MFTLITNYRTMRTHPATRPAKPAEKQPETAKILQTVSQPNPQPESQNQRTQFNSLQ